MDAAEKQYRRTLRVNCLVCGQSLYCQINMPLALGWLKESEVKAFFEAHRAHGNAETVGAEVVEVED